MSSYGSRSNKQNRQLQLSARKSFYNQHAKPLKYKHAEEWNHMPGKSARFLRSSYSWEKLIVGLLLAAMVLAGAACCYYLFS